MNYTLDTLQGIVGKCANRKFIDLEIRSQIN